MVKKSLSRPVFGGSLALILAVAALYPLSSRSEQSWPAHACIDEEYWFEFSGLQLCIDRADIAYLNHLNMDSPSVSIRLRTEGTGVEIGLAQLTDQEVTGGLHHHLGVDVRDVFSLLIAGGNEDDAEMARIVMGADDGAEVRHYKDEPLEAYAILRDVGGYSAVYVFQQGRDGAVQIAGVFGAEYAERLLAHARRSPTRR